MVRRFHRSIYDELDELRASMDYLYQLALEPAGNPLLPGDDVPGIVCQYLHSPNAEVAEYDDEVTVTVDTVAGTEDTKISVDLIDATSLLITCAREDEQTLDDDGNFLREERSVFLHQRIRLPSPVADAGARMSMRHGVLDIHLKKVPSLAAGTP